MIQILQVQKFFNSKFLSLSIIDILKQVFSVQDWKRREWRSAWGSRVTHRVWGWIGKTAPT